MTTRHKLRVIQGAAVVAPLALFALIRLAVMPAPAAAHADAPPPEPAPVAPPAKPLTQAQQAALNWIALQGASADVPSPLDHPVPKPVIVAPPPKAPHHQHEPTSPLDDIRVTGIIGNNEGGMAVVNNKIHRPGEEVAPGITIESIDARLNQVTLKLPDGSTVKLDKNEQPRRRNQPGATPSGPPRPTVRPGPSSGT